MKPLNEKEMNQAFFNTLALLTVIIILVMLVTNVYLDTKEKDFEELRIENKKLKESQNFSIDLSSELDSVFLIIQGFEKMSFPEYERNNRKFNQDMNIKWHSSINGNTELDKTKTAILKIIGQWSADRGSLITENEKIQRIKDLTTQIEATKKEFETQEREYAEYRKDHQ